MTPQVAVRIVCGDDGGRCGRLLAVVSPVPGVGMAFVANNDKYTKSIDVPRRQWRVPVPADLNGETPYFLNCPKHDPDSYIHRPGWFRNDHYFPPILPFPFALLEEPLTRWRATGAAQTLRWDRHH